MASRVSLGNRARGEAGPEETLAAVSPGAGEDAGRLLRMPGGDRRSMTQRRRLSSTALRATVVSVAVAKERTTGRRETQTTSFRCSEEKRRQARTRDFARRARLVRRIGR